MRNVVQVPRCGHARASSGCLKPNSAGSAVLLRFPSSAESKRNCSEGMARRAFQLLTAGSETPARSATAVVPPRASMMSSTVRSIGGECSRNVNVSRVHGSEIFTPCELVPYPGVPREPKDVAYRLELTREALRLTQTEISARLAIGKNAWSQYVDFSAEKPRRITIEVAYRLKDLCGATLEWIYDGDRTMLPPALRSDIAKIERGGGLEVVNGRWHRAPAATRKAG